jgi:hypothetical protein
VALHLENIMRNLAQLKRQHEEYNMRLEIDGHKLLKYRVPCCGALLKSRAANAGETWGTLATCPDCGEMYMKISTATEIRALVPEAA